MKLPPHALHSKDVTPIMVPPMPITHSLVPSDIVAVSMDIVVVSTIIVVELTAIPVLSTLLLLITPSSTPHLKEETMKQPTNKLLPLPHMRVKMSHLLPSTIPTRALDTVDSSPSALEVDTMAAFTKDLMVGLVDNTPSLPKSPLAMDRLASLLMVLSLPLATPPLKLTLPSHPRARKERIRRRDSVSSA